MPYRSLPNPQVITIRTSLGLAGSDPYPLWSGLMNFFPSDHKGNRSNHGASTDFAILSAQVGSAAKRNRCPTHFQNELFVKASQGEDCYLVPGEVLCINSVHLLAGVCIRALFAHSHSGLPGFKPKATRKKLSAPVFSSKPDGLNRQSHFGNPLLLPQDNREGCRRRVVERLCGYGPPSPRAFQS